MPRVKFIKDDKGSPDGLTLVEYKAGEEYDISDSLAKQFLLRRSVQLIETAPVIPDVQILSVFAEEKSANPVAEDKALKGAPSNKKKFFKKKG